MMPNLLPRQNAPGQHGQPATGFPAALRDILAAEALFADLERWTFYPVRGGRISTYTYRMVSGSRDFFVKEVTSNEKYTLRLLHLARANIAPVVHVMPLLEKGYLVTDFIAGERLAEKRLQPALIDDVAQMQNVLNDPSLFNHQPTPSGCKFTDRDDGFYRQAFIRHFQAGRQNLFALAGQYRLPIVDQFQSVADSVEKSFDTYVDEYAGMPFAWLHNDFREDNIIGDPQRLVDWGSSYGHGPFLVDLAPFLVDDQEALLRFTQASDIGKSVGFSAIQRWLAASLCARFVEFIRFRLALEGDDFATRETCRTFLEYEYPPFRHLLGVKL